MCQELLRPNYAKDYVDPHISISKKHLFLPPNLLCHHHKFLPLANILSIIPNQGSPWDVMNATAYLTSSGTANSMSVHCADKDSLDMPKRTVLIITMMMELKGILV